jgi:hypothetical protein
MKLIDSRRIRDCYNPGFENSRLFRQSADGAIHPEGKDREPLRKMLHDFESVFAN